MLTGNDIEKLLAKVRDLLANDAEFRAALPEASVSKAILEEGIGLGGLIQTVCEGYRDRPALGQRATERTSAGGRSHRNLLEHFETITYGELLRRVTALAAALSESPVRSGDRVATLGFSSVDYTVVDMAIPWLDAIAVPLHSGAPASLLQPMVDESEPSLLACSTEQLDTAARLAVAAGSVSKILVFDHHDDVDDHRDALSAARGHLTAAKRAVEVETLAAAIDRRKDLPTPTPPPARPDRLAAIIYTSGSSGSPKGAMHSEGLVQGAWSLMASTQVERGFAIPAITLNYLPMSHTGGRNMLVPTLGGGGTAYFVARSDLSTMLQDLALVRPTQLNFVPRVWEMLHHEFVSRVGSAVGRREIEEQVLSTLRNDVLGGRYITALTGSAPISPELAAWVERLVDMHLMDGFGSTESGAVIVDGRIRRPPVKEYRLDDVPELGYFGTDRPHPRGELLIKSATLFSGYYRREELTAEVFDDDGFYRTGDVVEELGPDELRYVDRRNNVLKLSNGEFVAVSKLETLFADGDRIHQIFVYGSGEHPYLVAVVVPTDDAVARYADADLKSALLASLGEAARRNDLRSYEVPRDILLEHSPFTLDNGLLTGIRKPSRPNLRKRYGEKLEALYAGHRDDERQRWRELESTVDRRPVHEIVCRAAGLVLGRQDGAPEPDCRFEDLGGDSLDAVTFVSSLSDLFDVEIEVGVVLSPVNDLQTIADHIERLRDPEAARPTFSSVHGAAASTVSAGQLTLDRFIDENTLREARELTLSRTTPKHVLLTGATGFLGRYLALDWLERMARVDGTVTCLVRAQDDQAARARLDAVYDSGDPELLSRYRSLARHLEVIAGDKGSFQMALDDRRWKELAEAVDLIIDPAALVNHMLPYPQLFGPNVVGTAEVIRLAIDSKLKPIVHVSSVAVGMTVAPGGFKEDGDVRVMIPARTVDSGYASGYATSKWAGEVLLREAHDLCSLPISVFRCDMIMAEPGFRGQLNLPDMVTRLILSVSATGLAPGSFYPPAPDGERARAHFDGLPVDFVRDSISTIGIDPASGYRTYHVVNPHDDGIGLDTFVDWMVEAGCRIERIESYEDWFTRFETALRNLPEGIREASLLPIAESFRFQQPAVARAFAPTAEFEAAVRRAGIGSNGKIPGIGPDIIVKYVTDLESLGYLDPTDRCSLEADDRSPTQRQEPQ